MARRTQSTSHAEAEETQSKVQAEEDEASTAVADGAVEAEPISDGAVDSDGDRAEDSQDGPVESPPRESGAESGSVSGSTENGSAPQPVAGDDEEGEKKESAADRALREAQERLAAAREERARLAPDDESEIEDTDSVHQAQREHEAHQVILDTQAEQQIAAGVALREAVAQRVEHGVEVVVDDAGHLWHRLTGGLDPQNRHISQSNVGLHGTFHEDLNGVSQQAGQVYTR